MERLRKGGLGERACRRREGRGKGLSRKGRGWEGRVGGVWSEKDRDWRRGEKKYSDSCGVLLTRPDLCGSFVQRAPFAKTWADCQRLNLHKRSTMEAILRVGPPLTNTCPMST